MGKGRPVNKIHLNTISRRNRRNASRLMPLRIRRDLERFKALIENRGRKTMAERSKIWS
jgi:hypothetical protein